MASSYCSTAIYHGYTIPWLIPSLRFSMNCEFKAVTGHRVYMTMMIEALNVHLPENRSAGAVGTSGEKLETKSQIGLDFSYPTVDPRVL